MKDVTGDDASVWIATWLEDTLSVAWRVVIEYLDSRDQGRLSLGLAIAGTCFVVRGFALVKPAFVVSLSLTVALRIQEVAAKQHKAIEGAICAAVVAACTCVLLHRIYPAALFLVGSSAAGLSTVLLRDALNLEHAHKELMALSILVSVPGGLLLKEFRIPGWRLLTPVAGGYLIATSCQYGEEDFSGHRMTWSSAGTNFPPFFAVIWGLGTLAGWYCQLVGPVFGEDPCSVPATIEHKLQQFHTKFPFLFDAEGMWPAPQAAHVSKALLREPFLKGTRYADADARPTCLRERSRIPELVIGFSILIVMLLNAVLISQPIFLLGHAILMSLAFLPLTTAGLLCYASDHRCFRGQSQMMEPIMRHASHATLGVLVLLCALLGCLSLYWNRLLAAESVTPSTWSRDLHVFVGYTTVGLLCSCSCSGAAKLVAAQRGERQQDVAPYHTMLGKLIYILATFNQVQGFFLQDLLPRWAALLLTVLVLVCVITVLTVLLGAGQTHGKLPTSAALENAVVKEEVPQLQLLGRPSPEMVGIQKAPGGRRRKRARQDWDAVVEAFEMQDSANLVSLCFLRWHRFAQSAHIAKAHAELQSSDNLVNFLSSTLLGEMRWRETNLRQHRPESEAAGEGKLSCPA